MGRGKVCIGGLVLPVYTAAHSCETLKDSSHVHDGLDRLECYGSAQGPITGNVALFWFFARWQKIVPSGGFLT